MAKMRAEQVANAHGPLELVERQMPGPVAPRARTIARIDGLINV
jgi:hypothetical protein